MVGLLVVLGFTVYNSNSINKYTLKTKFAYSSIFFSGLHKKRHYRYPIVAFSINK